MSCWGNPVNESAPPPSPTGLKKMERGTVGFPPIPKVCILTIVMDYDPKNTKIMTRSAIYEAYVYGLDTEWRIYDGTNTTTIVLS